VSTNVPAIDEIAVTIPAERRYLGVVNLVLGGLCTRLDFPYEQVDDLQLAVDSVLAPGRPQGAAVTLEAEADDDRLRLRLLDPLVGSAEAVERDGAEWIAIEVARRAAGAQAG
jgi:hypothetical protein